MNKELLLADGKAKSLYSTGNDQDLIMVFRDDTSAFDGEKTEKLAGKGKVNNLFNAFIMEHLEHNGVHTHFQKVLSATDSMVSRLNMIPVECVVRNFAAGSICRRLGIEEGLEFSEPLFEFFLKNDPLHDPLITEDHIREFGWADDREIQLMRADSLIVNDVLFALFDKADLMLVDFKLEFGRQGYGITLGDEFTPDGCRLWDYNTREKLDKDRFRHSMGGVIEAYEEVARRLGVPLDC